MNPGYSRVVNPTGPDGPLCTVLNCSTVLKELTQPENLSETLPTALETAAESGFTAVELWWPFATPTPTDTALNDFIDAITSAPVRLIAMNSWGGDMPAGERGVLHREALPTAHFDALRRIADATGLRFTNTLLGASGDAVTDTQREHLAAWVNTLAEVGVQPLVEPMSATPNYPVTCPWAAEDLARETGAGVLLDFYHLAVNGVDVEKWLTDVETGAVSMPAHVQLADAPGRGAPGTGEAPLQKWVSRLRTAGYRGDVAAEWMG
ncbi:TIM barrel protein [Corynebacterium sp. H113]|uniref:TIM barrel protein n=1 Tax=Corynebacterium sp. H113 TaxID=3133419 RepID=UPI0030B0BED5